MAKHYTCIVCPNGCDIIVEEAGGEYRISGEGCKRGRDYVLQEMTDPRRTIATSVRVIGGAMPLCSVRLTRPIPKARIMEAVQAIHALRPRAPLARGEVLIENLLGMGSDVIATRDVAAGE